MKRVFFLLLFVILISSVSAYLAKDETPVPKAINYLLDEDNIKDFPISVLGLGAMDLNALNKEIPEIYKEKILEKLKDSSVGGLGIAVAGLEAMCEDTSQILSPNDFNNNGNAENLLDELLGSEVSESVFDESMALMGLINAEKINTGRARQSIAFLIQSQADNGRIGNFIDEHSLAVMALASAKNINDSLVLQDALTKAGDFLISGSISEGKFNTTVSAYGMEWENVFYPSSTSTGLALGAIAALKLSVPEYEDIISGDADNPIEYLVLNSNSKGFKDNGQENQDFPNSMALMGAIGKYFPVKNTCPCENGVKVHIRIEGLSINRFDSNAVVKCTNVLIDGNNITNKKASALEALDSIGGRIKYNATLSSDGVIVTAINGETGDTALGGRIVYYIDSGKGYFSPNLSMMDYGLKAGDWVLIAVAKETYSQNVPGFPLPLIISIDDNRIGLNEMATVSVNSSLGNSIDNAVIYYEIGDDTEDIGETDGNGELDIDSLDPGTYKIWAELPNKYIRSEKIELRVDERTSSGFSSSVADAIESMSCVPVWKCTDWSDCKPNLTKSRACSVTNYCTNITERPKEEAECSAEPQKEQESEIQNKASAGITIKENVTDDNDEITGMAGLEPDNLHLGYGIAIIASIVLLGLIFAKVMKAI